MEISFTRLLDGNDLGGRKNKLTSMLPIFLQGYFYTHKTSPAKKHMHFRVTKVAKMDKRFGKLRVTSSFPIKEGMPFRIKEVGNGKFILVDSKGLLGSKRVVGKLERSRIYTWWKFTPKKREVGWKKYQYY